MNGLDDFLMGGNPHRVTVEWVCKNKNCTVGHREEIRSLVEYGRLVDEYACPFCGHEMEPED